MLYRLMPLHSIELPFDKGKVMLREIKTSKGY